MDIELIAKYREFRKNINYRVGSLKSFYFEEVFLKRVFNSKKNLKFKDCFKHWKYEYDIVINRMRYRKKHKLNKIKKSLINDGARRICGKCGDEIVNNPRRICGKCKNKDYINKIEKYKISNYPLSESYLKNI